MSGAPQSPYYLCEIDKAFVESQARHTPLGTCVHEDYRGSSCALQQELQCAWCSGREHVMLTLLRI